MSKIGSIFRYSLLSVCGAMGILVLGTEAFADVPAQRSTDQVMEIHQIKAELPTPRIFGNAVSITHEGNWK
jgi:hypothetical protein